MSFQKPGEKDWGYQRLEMVVEDGKSFDRLYTYVIYTSIKSLYRLNSTDNETFFVGNESQREMPIPKKSLAVGIAIGYKDGNFFQSLQEFRTDSVAVVQLSLSKTTEKEFHELVSKYDTFGQENSIEKDMDFLVRMEASDKEMEKYRSEQDFMIKLYQIAFPCYNALAFSEKYGIDLGVCDPSISEEISEIME